MNKAPSQKVETPTDWGEVEDGFLETQPQDSPESEVEEAFDPQSFIFISIDELEDWFKPEKMPYLNGYDSDAEVSNESQGLIIDRLKEIANTGNDDSDTEGTVAYSDVVFLAVSTFYERLAEELFDDGKAFGINDEVVRDLSQMSPVIEVLKQKGSSIGQSESTSNEELKAYIELVGESATRVKGVVDWIYSSLDGVNNDQEKGKLAQVMTDFARFNDFQNFYLNRISNQLDALGDDPE